MLKGSHHKSESNRKNSVAHIGMGIGRRNSDEVKIKMSISKLGNLGRLGMKLSESHKAKISFSRLRRIAIGELTGWKHTPEALDKISEASALHIKNGYRRCYQAVYNGINFIEAKEMLFAMWCDDNDIRWEYQPLIFRTSFGKRYVPDFKLLDSGEFVEVGELGGNKGIKMTEFVRAGNTLYFLTNSIELGEKTKWVG